MSTFGELAHTLHHQLGQHFPTFLVDFQKNITDANQSYEIALDTLLIMRRMFRSKGQSASSKYFADNAKTIVDMILMTLSHDYSKIISEGLRVAGSFVQCLKGTDGSTLDPRFSAVCAPLFKAVRAKLEKRDIDQEVKQCSIIATSNLVCVMHKTLAAADIATIIDIFNDRLQNELTRDATLKGISKMALNSDAKDGTLIQLQNLDKLLPRMYDLLHKTSRTLHLNTLEAIQCMMSRYNPQFAAKVSDIMKETIPFISESDL